MKWHGFGEPDKPKVIEVEKAQRVPPMDADIARSIQTLQSHPGFLYILAKLKFQREVLKTQVATTRQASMEDVIMLQSGVAWSGWLQTQLDQAIGFKSTSAPATPAEITLFEEAQRNLEVLR
jgi:hypothetical protein